MTVCTVIDTPSRGATTGDPPLRIITDYIGLLMQLLACALQKVSNKFEVFSTRGIPLVSE